MNPKKIIRVSKSRPTIEGAGVHLKRVFGNNDLPLFDPFLMMDDFRIPETEKYIKGFPWHPHRGIETITYILSGSVEHSDSMGNKGTINAGDVQWMTAGSGIIHQEMPQVNADQGISGFQFWANLPAKHKMMKPRYQEIKAKDIPIIHPSKGVEIKLICGSMSGVDGPVKDIVTSPELLDVTLEADTLWSYVPGSLKNTSIYVIGGSCSFDLHTKDFYENETLILFGEGEEVWMKASSKGARMLILSGVPLKERIAWGGPIVMNTQEELEQAFEDYQNGTFIKE